MHSVYYFFFKSRMKWDIRYLFPFTRLVTLSGSARYDEKRLNPASMMCSRVTKPGLMIGCRNSSEYLFEGLKLWRSGDFSELPHNEGCACLGVGASQSHSWESDRASAGIGMDTASEDFIKKKKRSLMKGWVCVSAVTAGWDVHVPVLMAPPEALVSGPNCETNQTCESFLFWSRSPTALFISSSVLFFTPFLLSGLFPTWTCRLYGRK